MIQTLNGILDNDSSNTVDKTVSIEDILWEYLVYFDRFERCERNLEPYFHLLSNSENLLNFDTLESDEWSKFSNNRYYVDVSNEHCYIQSRDFGFEVLKSWEDLVPRSKCDYCTFGGNYLIDFADVKNEHDMSVTSEIQGIVSARQQNVKTMSSLYHLAYYHPASLGSCKCYLESYEGDNSNYFPTMYKGSLCFGDKMMSCVDNPFHRNIKAIECNINSYHTTDHFSSAGYGTKTYYEYDSIYGCSGNRWRKKSTKGNIVTINGRTTEVEKVTFENIEFSGESSIEKTLSILEDFNIMQMLTLRRKHFSNSHLEKLRGNRERLREIICTICNALCKSALPSYCENPSFFNSMSVQIVDTGSITSTHIRDLTPDHYLTSVQELNLEQNQESSLASFCLTNSDTTQKASDIDMEADLTVVYRESSLVTGGQMTESCTVFESYTEIYSKGIGEIEPDIGASLCFNVTFGEFLKSIQVFTYVEVKFNKGWKLCKVLSLKYQGEILRFVKVRPTRSFSSINCWICLDDGFIAPLGTNLSELCTSI